MKKKIIITAMSLAAMISLSACNKLDVIGDTSIVSFEKVMNTATVQVTEDTASNSWSLTAPDGEARFLWSKDFSKTETYDVWLEADAQPFINAGLDPNKLPEGMFTDGKLIVGTELSNESPDSEGEPTPVNSYEQIVKQSRMSVKYHAALDHFGVDLAKGNTFEWAKDMSKNDKDIVFVLDPQVLIDAGVDPAKVEGWAFAEVETMDEKGKMVELDKFLKPFDLDGLK